MKYQERLMTFRRVSAENRNIRPLQIQEDLDLEIWKETREHTEVEESDSDYQLVVEFCNGDSVIV